MQKCQSHESLLTGNANDDTVLTFLFYKADCIITLKIYYGLL